MRGGAGATPIPTVAASAGRREPPQDRTAPAAPARIRRCRRKTFQILTAISGEMPRFSFTSSDSVVLTPEDLQAIRARNFPDPRTSAQSKLRQYPQHYIATPD